MNSDYVWEMTSYVCENFSIIVSISFYLFFSKIMVLKLLTFLIFINVKKL